ncbi:MAG: hypothetical protein HZC28_16270 [Spirochaetes bacterium]|nr:hypothetical protein [Spirochaetota bacterium]
MKYAVLACLCIIMISCVTYRNLPTLNLEKDAVTDDVITNALASQVKTAYPVNVMWYNLGSDDLYRGVMFTNATVARNDEIPSAFIHGYKDETRDIFGLQPKLNMKYLRFLAARNKCDILMLTGVTFVEKTAPNWLALLDVFIVPIFCVPYLDITHTYTGDIFVFDVRTGTMMKYIHFTTNMQYSFQLPWYVRDCATNTLHVATNAAIGYMREKLIETLR